MWDMTSQIPLKAQRAARQPLGTRRKIWFRPTDATLSRLDELMTQTGMSRQEMLELLVEAALPLVVVEGGDT